MPQSRLVPLGFLLAALLLAALPVVSGLLASGWSTDEALHDTYFVVLPLWLLLVPPVASVLFAAAYLAGTGLAGWVFRPILLWTHLGLWIAGAVILLTPPLVASVVIRETDTYSVGVSPDVDRLMAHQITGYCVTLLSALVFAICIADAIRKARPATERVIDPPS